MLISDPLVRAVESGTLRQMTGATGTVYSTFLVILGSGVRVLSAESVARLSGLSERHTRTAIDTLVSRRLVCREPLRAEHAHRFTARYSLPPEPAKISGLD